MNPCSSLLSLISINLNELIGKSLNTINTNFSLLKEQTCIQNSFLSRLNQQYSFLQTKTLSLSSELKKSSKAYVLFDSLGNILKQKNISSVQYLSLGRYQINFSSLLNEYIVIPDTVSSSLIFVNIVNETPNSVIITTRLSDGTLVNPEKISLTFFV